MWFRVWRSDVKPRRPAERGIINTLFRASIRLYLLPLFDVKFTNPLFRFAVQETFPPSPCLGHFRFLSLFVQLTFSTLLQSFEHFDTLCSPAVKHVALLAAMHTHSLDTIFISPAVVVPRPLIML